MGAALKREVLPVLQASDEQRFVLQAGNWDFYDQFLNLLGDRPAITGKFIAWVRERLIPLCKRNGS